MTANFLDELADALAVAATRLATSPNVFHKAWGRHLESDRTEMLRLMQTWREPELNADHRLLVEKAST